MIRGSIMGGLMPHISNEWANHKSTVSKSHENAQLIESHTY